ncbi:vinorine synthase-like protein [Tanacetum coccineum]
MASMTLKSPTNCSHLSTKKSSSWRFRISNKASVENGVKNLKETLSEILSRFYPLAGEVKDCLHIGYNDNLRELFPESPVTLESSIGNYIIGVQVNIFNCGGIGLSMSISHMIIDGNTYFLFMKAWAAAVRGPKVACTSSSTSKSAPTRTEATTALIWKAAAKATSIIRPFDPQSPHTLLSYVNFRKRGSPPLPYESIGKLLRTATGICFPESEPDLSTLMGEIRESIAKINSDHIKSLKVLKKLKDLTDVTKQGDHCLFMSSVLNSGIHNLDFGWRKPIRFHVMNNRFSRFVTLTDTFKGGGVEATITLKSDQKEIFERDPELLSYATVNPSPL